MLWATVIQPCWGPLGDDVEHNSKYAHFTQLLGSLHFSSNPHPSLAEAYSQGHEFPNSSGVPCNRLERSLKMGIQGA